MCVLKKLKINSIIEIDVMLSLHGEGGMLGLLWILMRNEYLRLIKDLWGWVILHD